MALFFDQAWFDAKLASLGFDRAVIGSALGLSQNQIDEIWKDQREISAQEVATLATLLQVDPSEIATRAGISTPIPQLAADPLSGTDAQQDLQNIKKRLDRLERDVAEILTLLRADRN